MNIEINMRTDRQELLYVFLHFFPSEIFINISSIYKMKHKLIKMYYNILK